MTMSVRMTEPRLRARLADGSLTGAWQLDPAQSSVHLRSRSMWGLAPVKGVFGEVAGEGSLSAEGKASGTITVATASIDTKIKKRDEHLRSAELFDSEKYPHIVFTADELTPAGDEVIVAGTLRVRDRTKRLSIPVTVTASGDDEVRIEAELHVDRSDFGITWNQLGMASMKNVLTVTAVFVRR